MIAFSSAAPEGEKARGIVRVAGLTDSTVAASVIGRGATTSFPLCLLAMEVSAQMEERGVALSLEWAPRELNQEADALSNLVFSGFTPANRVHLDPARLPFLVLPELQATAEGLQEEVAAARRRRAGLGTAIQTRGRKQRKLRETEPW